MRLLWTLLSALLVVASAHAHSAPTRDQLLLKLLNSKSLRQFLRSDPGSYGSGQGPLSSGGDLDKTTLELIRENGYPAEEHDITTKDGYILTIHRIPHGIAGPGDRDTPRPVVHLQHGLLSSSSDWIMQPPQRALAYMLADRGYDVWLGNARGNTYSRQHVNMTHEDPEFWKFTWDQMGQYDAPAMIDYILNATSNEKLYWIGHSMGSTMFWVMMEDQPQYNEKVALMHALGPVARVDHMTSVIRLIAPLANDIEALAELIGYDEFLPSAEYMTLLSELLCEPFEITQVICDDILFLLCGFDSQQLNETALPVIVAHTPAGASTRTVVHYAQEINAKKFQHFDWGKKENMVRYGQETPPEYGLDKVTCPVVLCWSDNDILADPKDVTWLASLLPNMVEKYRVPLAAFNHLDYLWAMDADTLIYNHVIDNLSKY